MITEINYSSEIADKHAPDDSNELVNYCEFLSNLGCQYFSDGPYYQVKEPGANQGWILHLSVILSQLDNLLLKIIPILVEEGIPFKIPQSQQYGNLILAGHFGYHQLGKIITIYPDTDDQARSVAKKMILLTTEFSGPSIPTDAFLGGTVYTRYGSYNTIRIPDDNGKVEKYLYDLSKTLVKDKYNVPFKLPKGIKWPFFEIKGTVKEKKSRLLAGKYLQMLIVKNDTKGKVVKALDIKNWARVNWCIVKQAKKFMCSDIHGRDIRDRLYWQYELQKSLENVIPIPKAIDFFYLNEDAYLVMEYIEGQDLSEFIYELYGGKMWEDLEIRDRNLLLDYLLKIIDIVFKLHKKELVHRDLQPRNFMITKNGEIVAIDLELCYSTAFKKPTPAFTLGTPGFMSPEQINYLTPTIEQDLFALGGLLIKFLTGVTPAKFVNEPSDRLQRNLAFYIKNQEVVSLITDCFQSDKSLRPDIYKIRSCIESLKANQAVAGPAIENAAETVDQEELSSIIEKGLNSLCTSMFSGNEQIWFSRTLDNDIQRVGELTNFTFYSGLHTGLSGVLYTISVASEVQKLSSMVVEHYIKNRKFLEDHFLYNLDLVPPGYFYGSAGIAVLLNQESKTRFSTTDVFGTQRDYKWPNSKSSSLDLKTGIAGQGMALLKSYQVLKNATYREIANDYVSTLLGRQNKNGSWLAFNGTRNECHFGLATGVAGIICFLLKFGSTFNDARALTAAERGLAFLLRNMKKSNNTRYWEISSAGSAVDPWLEIGFTGVAFTFIKAFEILGDPKFKKIAESTLISHPKHLISQFLSISSGMAGLGEVYLEAYRVFKDEEWLTRSNWLVTAILNTACHESENVIYWLTDHTTTPTADLMTGNGGVIHYLLRHRMPDRIEFPLFY